jgi:hypothetical protein
MTPKAWLIAASWSRTKAWRSCLGRCGCCAIPRISNIRGYTCAYPAWVFVQPGEAAARPRVPRPTGRGRKFSRRPLRNLADVAILAGGFFRAVHSYCLTLDIDWPVAEVYDLAPKIRLDIYQEGRNVCRET